MRTRQASVFFALFASSWVVDYRGNALSRPIGTPEGLVMLAGVFVFGALLFNVGSRALVRAAAAFGLVVLWADPHLSNHETLYVWLCGAIVAAWGVLALRARSLRVDEADFDAAVTGVARWLFLASYVWAAFHKWNAQFLDPANSCAVYQIERFHELLPLVPAPEAFLRASGHATIAVEALLPVLLVLPRTRRLGILLGLAFHTVLGIGFPGFQYFVFACLLLFVPEPVWQDVFARVWSFLDASPTGRLLAAWGAKRWVRAAAGLALALASVELFAWARPPAAPRVLGHQVYALFSLASLGSIAVVCLLGPLRSPAWRAAAPVRLAAGIPGVLWLVPVAVALQGLQPHLGIKDVQAFAMFSNLDTGRGRSNHFVLPASMQVSRRLADTVVVHGSNHPEIRALGNPRALQGSVLRADPMPRLRPSWLELRREVARVARTGFEGLVVDYSHRGRRRRVENAERDPALSHVTFLERTWLKTRPVAIDHPGACRW